MTYATKQDMIDRFAEREVIALTDRDDAGVINDAVLAAALVTADAEINPYLVGRVTLPFASVPIVLVGYACDIARYRLTGAAVVETDPIVRRYRDAMDFLKMVASGKVSLGVDASNQQPASPAGGTVKFTTGSRVFSRDATEQS